MRFTSCQATDMGRWFWFSLLLTHWQVTENAGTKNCIVKQQEEVWVKTGEDASVECHVSSECSAEVSKQEWFVFKETSHLRLNLENSIKYSLEKKALHIQSLSANDSGIYHCAVVFVGQPGSGRQHVGPGTYLIVTENRTTKRNIMWLSFALLVTYNMALLTLFLLKKFDCNINFKKKMFHKAGKNKTSKKTKFRDVLQEMNNKGNVKRAKQTAGRSHSEVEAASPGLSHSDDEIYQNF
ncbi:immunoglobulin superfamily member 6 [Echeneis naucrates]|uniref:immunoglobulin superfamily member 6 n=1 Tax=Echeneis naucrates TaxID=173247 RepID=UPI001113A04C|nr:immunoglobulin superfamily member 6-like [Echeneis naucrates]